METAAFSVVPLGLLCQWPLQMWITVLGLDPKAHQGRMVVASNLCLQSLTPCRSKVYLSSGVHLGSVPSRQEVVVMDAYHSGWGAVWSHRTASGIWDPLQRPLHINVLELCAVHLPLRHFLPFLKNRHGLVRSDNTSTVYHMNHQEGTRSYLTKFLYILIRSVCF